MNKRFTLRALAALAIGGALALAAPLAASAHVHVAPDTATAGDDDAYFGFRVPTESATASTVGVTVQLPTSTPFTAVSYEPVPGWTAKVTTSTLPKPVKIDGTTMTEAPTSVTFTATDGGIAPGQFQIFTVALGLIPDTGKIELPVTQTYSDGSVVHWDQSTPANGTEPAHPAPVLYINDAPPADGAAAPAPDSGLTTVALIVGLAGLVIGAAGVVIAVVALTRSRRGAA
ncbi:MAG: YcnI family protein [Microbacteriaceae bacterium]|nr:YcnI family protein [Microbacteriaceae bacterium]MCL2793700.1 YcnI family protein [Microbacteriaceae bacterium]